MMVELLNKAIEIIETYEKEKIIKMRLTYENKKMYLSIMYKDKDYEINHVIEHFEIGIRTRITFNDIDKNK